MVNVDFSTPRPSTVEASVSYLLYVPRFTPALPEEAIPYPWPLHPPTPAVTLVAAGCCGQGLA